MLRLFTCLCCTAILCGAAYCQSDDTPRAFEAADVHASPHRANGYVSGGLMRGGRYQLRYASMVDLIAAAYGVDAEKVLGGPSWLEMDHYEVIARTPPRTTAETVKPMLQALLAERFHLAAHSDSRAVPAYVLTAGKHPALKPADGSGETGCQGKVEGGGRGQEPSTTVPSFVVACHNTTMAAFVESLRDSPAQWLYLNNTTVVDQTGLEGAWDFSFKYSLRGMRAAGASDITTVFDAVDKQLGLKLEPGKAPMPVVVVDRVDRTPTPNAPDIAERLHAAPAPTEFEVADVKPTDADFKGMRFQIQPGGRVNLQGMTLKFLIEQAWNLSDDMLVGAPKWMDTDRFDIVAKAPASAQVTGSGSAQPEIDFDTVLAMVRALVVERFKLVTHTEQQPVAAYTLMAAKPRMKPADPASRTRFKEGPATLESKDPRNSNPALSRLVTCQNMTMAQFAEELQGIAPGYIHSPVLDATGLEGGWDFTLSFSPVGMMRGGGRAGRGGDDPPPPTDNVLAASDPGTGMTLFEAMEKEIGLKLVLQKRPVSVLVIDSVERKPLDN